MPRSGERIPLAVRYMGSKYLSAPWIVSHFPGHKTYCEPLGGGASVLIEKAPAPAGEFYNDLCGEMVNLFTVYRDMPVQLEQQLRKTPFSESELLLAGQPSDDPLEQSRRTLVKAFMSHGSDGISRPQRGFRFGNRGHDDVPVSFDWYNYPDRIERISNRLRKVTFFNRPAGDVITKLDSKHTLHYIDPPYLHQVRKDVHKHNYKFEMTEDDHRDLALQLNQCKGMVIVSGYPAELYDNDLYKGWETRDRSVRDQGSNARIERIWMNQACLVAQRQQRINI